MWDSSRNKRALLAVSLTCLVCFLLIALLRGSFEGINSEVNLWAAAIHTGSFTAVAKLVADGFDTTPLLIVSFVVGVVLFLLKMKRNALVLVGTMVGNAAVLETLKSFIYSPRPANELVFDAGNSFPSGHVVSTAVLFGLLAYFAWPVLKSTHVKVVLSLFVVTLASFVGFTRIYLNVHWLSDVLAGYFLGVFWLTFCIAIAPYLAQIYTKKYSGKVQTSY